MTHDIDPVAVRQRLHRHPEPFWREFHTTSIIVEELERVGVDEVHVGRAALAADERLGVPDEATLEKWQERAERAGAREDVLEATAGGATGVVARVDRGDGPTVGLRVDIDGLAQTEATTRTQPSAWPRWNEFSTATSGGRSRSSSSRPQRLRVGAERWRGGRTRAPSTVCSS